MTKLNVNPLRDQKVLVTGASGFLGSPLCRRLWVEGAEIFATSRSSRADAGDRFHWLQLDLSDVSAMRRIVKDVRPDVVFHLSGLATAVCGLDLVLPTLHSLLLSTVNLLTVIAESGTARVVLAGSMQEPKADDDEATPTSPYSAAKWASSAYGRMFSRLYALPVVNLRIFQTYGPGQDVRKLIPYVTLALLRKEKPQLSNGNWEADWVYIDDVINGLIAAAGVRNVPSRAIDLGSGRLMSVRDIVAHLVRLTDSPVVPAFGVLPDRPLEPVHVAAITDAQSALGWTPAVSMVEGLRRTVEALRQTKSDERQSPRFQTDQSPRTENLHRF
jgi:nucleoside-diphosphate-sugar epimerase